MKMRWVRVLRNVASVVAVYAFGLGAAQANLLVDGGFDNPTINPIPYPFYTNYGPANSDPHYGGTSFDNAWQITRGNVDLVQQLGGWSASPASSPYYLDLNGNAPGTIEQSFATVIGQQYSLNFWYSNNAGGSPNPDRATVTVAALSDTIEHYGATSTNLNWTYYSNTFTATSALTMMSFSQVDNCCNGGILLDSINVSAVPEPASWMMMILGFFGLGFLGYRQKASFAVRAF